MTTEIPSTTSQAGGNTSKSFTRFIPQIARVLMGMLFFITGLNGFLDFIPQPKDPMPETAMALIGAFIKSGYLFQLVAGTEFVVGVLLLINRFVPLALALIAPVVVNIVAFHIFLEPKGIGLAIFVLVMEIYLAWSYRSAFSSMLALKNTPGGK